MFIMIVAMMLGRFVMYGSNYDLSRGVRVQGINLGVTCVSNGWHASLPLKGGASLHIAVDNVNQLFGCSLLPRFGPFIFVKNVAPDMALEQLSHKTIESAPASRDLLQHLMTIGFVAEQTLNRFHLSLYPADPRNQPRLITFCVCHNFLGIYSPQVYALFSADLNLSRD